MSKLLFGGDAAWPTFSAVNDTLRGGASTSSFAIDRTTNVATFSGHLDITALGGAGFASQSTVFPSRLSLPRSRTSGLLLTFLPPAAPATNPATGTEKPQPRSVTRFVLALKTSEPAHRPDGRRESVTVYEWTFDASERPDELCEGEKGSEGAESVTRLARWDEFRPTYRGRPAEGAEPLDPGRIYELSFMARSHFGEQAGDFALEIVSLSAAAVASGRRQSWLARVWAAFAGLWARSAGCVRAWWSADRDGAVRLP